jgi:hypothetical protein
MSLEFISLTKGVAFRETLRGFETAERPWMAGFTIGVEARFFTISLLFIDADGNTIDITGYEISEITNLYTYEGNLIFNEAPLTGFLELRPETFATITKFSITIPGYQRIDFAFTQAAGERNDLVVKPFRVITALHDSDANVYIPAKADDPENDIIL